MVAQVSVNVHSSPKLWLSRLGQEAQKRDSTSPPPPEEEGNSFDDHKVCIPAREDRRFKRVHVELEAIFELRRHLSTTDYT